MRLLHKFESKNWGDGFSSRMNILISDKYNPEIFFVGTFNPNLDWNHADFYYGRNGYFWPILSNLFTHNSSFLKKKRFKSYRQPDIAEILEICAKAKISFCDIIHHVKAINDLNVCHDSKSVTLDKVLKIKSYSDRELENAAKLGLLCSNVENIINHIENLKSVKYIVYTFKNNGSWFESEVDRLKKNLPNLQHIHIFTPTANGFRENLSPPYDSRLASLCHCWLWNDQENSVHVSKKGYDSLPKSWLLKHGVNRLKF